MSQTAITPHPLDTIPWGKPERISFSGGMRMLQLAPYSSDLDAIIQEHREAALARGIHVVHEKDAFSLRWWRAPNAQELAEAMASTAASFATESDLRVPTPPGMRLDGYQLAGIDFALKREGTLIGDDMGLGKTAQAIGLINVDQTIKKVLIICPASLRRNWRAEFRKWLVRPEMTIGICESAGDGLPEDPIVVIGYDGVMDLKAKILNTEWDLIVVDEGQYIKTPDALRSLAIVGGREMVRELPSCVKAVNADPTIKRVLLVCPDKIVRKWASDFRRGLERKELSVGACASAEAGKPDTPVVVIGREAALALREKFAGTTWDLLITDEGMPSKPEGVLRGLGASSRLVMTDRYGKQAKRPVLHAPLKAKRRVILSGTPFENRPIEIFNLIHWVAPSTFPDRFAFAKRYCDAKQKTIGKGKTAWDFSGESNMDELRELLRSTVMIRRMKVDVLKDLPPKRRTIVELTSDGMGEVIAKESDAYRTWQDRKLELAAAENDDKMQGTLQSLRAKVQRAEDCYFVERKKAALKKLPSAIEYLENIAEIDPLHKVVVFAHHKEVIAALRKAFEKTSVQVVGGMSDDEKEEAVRSFQEDANTQFFFGNIDAAGVGLNLTASSHVIFIEFPWDPGKLNQAEDRCNRRGQINSVFVEHLVLSGSVDAKTLTDIFAKQAVSDQILGGDPVRAKGPRAIVPLSDEVSNERLAQLRELVESRRCTGIDAYLAGHLARHDRLSDEAGALALSILSRWPTLDAKPPEAPPRPDPLPFSDEPPKALSGDQGSFTFAA